MSDMFLTSISKSELKAIISETIIKELARLKELQRVTIPEPSTPETNIFISQTELVKRLNVSVFTLIKWKHSGKLPFKKIGRKVLYDWRAVKTALNLN